MTRDGDERAFRALYERHTPRLLRFAMRLTAGAGDAAAEEIVQETWMRAVEGLERFGWRSSLATWLHGIALNVAREAWRRADRSDALEETSNPRPSASRAGSVETRIDLERALARLPRGRRAVLVLHDLHGYTHADVARMLDIAEGTSKSQLHDARAQLESILTEGGAS